MANRPKKVINKRYQIKRLIGEGGMGRVFLVRDLLDHKAPGLALKQFNIEEGARDRLVALFKREFHTLGQLHHPGLAQVFDFGVDTASGRLFYTAEFIAGENLSRATKGLGLQEVLQVLGRICLAVDFIHERGILHNDIKPSNVIVRESDHTPVLLDFGLSQWQSQEQSNQLPGSGGGGIIGTPAYMAPELMRGNAPTVASDLFALGMVFYKVLTRRLPFQIKKAKELFNAYVSEPFPRPRRFQPDLPEPVENIVMGLLQKDPAKRIQTASEVFERLSLCVGEAIGMDYDHNLRDLSEQKILVGRDAILRKINYFIFSKVSSKHLEAYLDDYEDDARTVETTFISLDETRETQHPLVRILGEPGVGKTTILSAIKRQSQLLEVPFFLVDCRAEPRLFKSWLRVFIEVSGMLGDGHAALKSFELIRSILAGKAAELNADLDETSFFIKVLEFLNEAYAHKPFIVALDNIDQADALTKRFLTFIDKLPADYMGLKIPTIIVTYDSEISEAFLTRDSAAKTYHLEPLSLSECASVFQHYFSQHELPESLAGAIHRFSNGNPRYVLEILRQLIESDGVVRARGRWDLSHLDISKISFPKTLQAFLAERFQSLGAQMQEILLFTAIWQQPIHSTDLNYLVRTDRQTLSGQLKELCQQELLTRDDEGRFILSQGSFEQIVLQHAKGLSEKHTRAAAYLETWEEKRSDLLAYHFAQSQQSEPAARYAIEAAEQAHWRVAQDDAAKHYRLAIEQSMLAKLPEITARAQFGLAKILWRQGKRKDSCMAFESFLELGNPKKHLADFVEAWRSLGVAHRDRGEFQEATAYFEKAIELLGDQNPALLGEIAAHLALVYQRSGETELMQSWFDRALKAVTKGNGFLPEAASVLISLGYLMLLGKERKRALQLYQDALTLSIAAKDTRRRAVILLNLASIAAQEHELVKAIEYYEESLSILRQLGDTLNTCNALFYLGNVEYLRGEFVKSKSHLDQALEYATGLDNPRLTASILTSLGKLETDRGEFKLASEYLKRAQDHARQAKDKAGLLRIQKAFENFFIAIKHFEKAAEFSEKLLQKAQDPELAFLSRLSQLVIATEQGISDQTQTLIEHLKANSTELKDPDLQMLYQARLLDYYLSIDDRKQCARIVEEAEKIEPKWVIPSNLLMFSISRLEFELNEAAGKSAQNLLGQLQKHSKNPIIAENFQLRVKALTVLAQAFEGAGDYRNAYDTYLEVRQYIADKLGGLEKSLQKSFLGSSTYKNLVGAIERLKAERNQFLADPKALDAALSRYRKLIAINRQLTANWRDRQGLLDFIIDTALDLVDGLRGFIVLKQQSELQVLASRNLSDDPNWDADLAFSHSIAQDVLKTGVSRVYLDALKHDGHDVSQSMVDLALKSVICVPLKFESQIVGVLYLDNDQKKGLFNQSDLEVLNAMADQATLVLYQSDAFLVLEKEKEEVNRQFNRAKSLIDQQAKALTDRFRFGDIVGGKDPEMQQVFDLIERVMASDASVLIQGESGTGKERVARAIHYSGTRQKRPFVAVNCSGLNPNLLESELFGHKKGAFTGADRDKEGLFVVANGGTVFLDELADMPIDLQAKLLRVLQEREIQPVGSSETIPVDIRVISASNRNLQDLVAEGTFREDLFYRLNVVLINLPPLRKRRLDLDLLTQHFVSDLAKRLGEEERPLSSRVRKYFHTYDWPGNIRELHHVLEYAMMMTKGKRIEMTDLPEYLQHVRKVGMLNVPTMDEAKDEFYKQYVTSLLAEFHGHITKAAKHAGIKRETLSRLVHKYELVPKKNKAG